MNNTIFKSARLAPVVLLVALLSACASMSPNSLRDPSVSGAYGLGDSAKNLPTDEVPLGQNRAVKDVTKDLWWQGFGDERLNRLVAQVLTVNTDLASAGFRLKRARLSAGLATDDLFPDFDVSGSAGNTKQLSGNSPSVRSYSVSASLGYELDLWGRLRTARTIAQWEAQATEEDLQTTFLTLVGDTCDIYWTLAFLNQRIVSGEESLARVERTLALVRTQFDSGAVSRLELREAEQNLQSQQAAQSQLIQQRVETRNALTVLLDGQPWPVADEPQTMTNAHSPEIEAGIPAELLGRRPDLRAAELRLRESLAQIKVVRTSYYPAIGLNASVGGSSTSLSDVLANPVQTLGVGLALPFINWNEARLNTAIAGTEYEIAANDFRRTLYLAFTEVDNALSARVELTKQVDLSQQSFAAASEVERLYEVRYRSGATPLRSWLDAQETLRISELSLAQARLTQLQNDSRLFQALGGSAQ
jgi:NodT family efflux transporter outer membrane factor (OMF) lipoprotein